MRVQGANSAGFAPVRGPRSAGIGAFRLSGEAPAQSVATPLAPRGIGGIDALMALQAIEEPGERRRRAVKRGHRLLDTLDAVKIALLGGKLDTATVDRLRAASAEAGPASGDGGLDDVLAQIDLRAQVEIAKFTSR